MEARMKINVLGREYELREATSQIDPVLKNNDGYCDPSVGLCVIDAMEEKEVDSLKDMESFKRKITRHELIHAFLAESGLSDQCEWACEEMVDWLAYQFPKMAKAFEKAGCME